MNAIYLIGCYFSQSPRFAEFKNCLLADASSGIADGLQHSDRLVDIASALSLVAFYHYANGQVLEGYQHCFLAVKLAMTIGLHQISIPEPLLRRDSFALLPPAHDEIELRNRVSTFWQIFRLDRSWSVANGLPTALPDDHTLKTFAITTPWPQPARSSVSSLVVIEQST